MKALRFHGREDVRVADVEEPEPGPGQVKLRIGYAGICGSDLHIFFDPDNSGMDYTRPHPVTGATLPQILGHELAGEVVEVGPGVDDVEVGDRAGGGDGRLHASMLSASGTLPQFHPEIPWTSPVITRAQELERGSWGAGAAGEAVTRTITATIVSSVAAAAAAGVRSPT